MKTAIIYHSTHHGNTKKLCDAIAAQYEVTLIDATVGPLPPLEPFDLIGIASGIAFGRFYAPLLEQMDAALPEGKDVFFLFTAGSVKDSYTDAIAAIAARKGCTCRGTYSSKGFDTYGPLRLIGGINKGRPNADDLRGAADFFSTLL